MAWSALAKKPTTDAGDLGQRALEPVPSPVITGWADR
jgi:hypothetical protein